MWPTVYCVAHTGRVLFIIRTTHHRQRSYRPYRAPPRKLGQIRLLRITTGNYRSSRRPDGGKTPPKNTPSNADRTEIQGLFLTCLRKFTLSFLYSWDFIRSLKNGLRRTKYFEIDFYFQIERVLGGVKNKNKTGKGKPCPSP